MKMPTMITICTMTVTYLMWMAITTVMRVMALMTWVSTPCYLTSILHTGHLTDEDLEDISLDDIYSGKFEEKLAAKQLPVINPAYAVGKDTVASAEILLKHNSSFQQKTKFGRSRNKQLQKLYKPSTHISCQL